MKTILLRLSSVAFLAFGLNACVGPAVPVYGPAAGGPAYESGYAESYGPEYDGDQEVAYYDSYGHYSPVFMPGYVAVYARYDRYGHRDRYGYYDRHGHDVHSHSTTVRRDWHPQHHASSSRSSSGHTSSSHSSQQLYTHSSAGSNRGAPQGEHTKSWYQQRGYSTARLTPANQSSNKSSSSKKKKDDDDHHHH